MMEDILVPTTAVWDVVVDWFTHCEQGYNTAHTTILPDGTAVLTGEKLLSIDLTEENRVSLLRQVGSFAQERAGEFQSKRREKLARQKDKTNQGKVPDSGLENVDEQGLGGSVESMEMDEVKDVAMTVSSSSSASSAAASAEEEDSAVEGMNGVGVESVDASSLLLSETGQSRTERRLMSFGRNPTRASRAKADNNDTANTNTTTATAAAATTNNKATTSTNNSNATAVKSFRHQLQEYCQKRGHPNPIYETKSIGTFSNPPSNNTSDNTTL